MGPHPPENDFNTSTLTDPPESCRRTAPRSNGAAAPGLPERDLGAIARAHAERADSIRKGLNINDEAFAKLNADLRQQLADMGVLPEHIEIEFERVMAAVFMLGTH
jgi:hypothetical protein